MAVEKRIVITGGPCAGKTNCKSTILEGVLKAGYIPIFIGETATEVKTSGIDPCANILDTIEFQTLLSKLQIAKENLYLEALENLKGKFLLFCDRGLLDNKAYMSEEQWRELLNKLEINDFDVFNRYDFALHLVSAAEGAEEYYTNENNKARSETLEEAKIQERKNKEAYYGFSHIYYFDNDCDFKEKLNKVLCTVLSSIGKAEPILGAQRKYVVNKISQKDLNTLGAQSAEIVQTYLQSKSSDIERRVRKIIYYGNTAYYYTKKNKDRLIIEEVPITKREYELLLEERYNDSDICKTRWYFNFNNLYFQYDEFDLDGDFKKYAILEAQVTNLQKKIRFLPKCFEEHYDVTESGLFTNLVIATNSDMQEHLVEYAKHFEMIAQSI